MLIKTKIIYNCHDGDYTLGFHSYLSDFVLQSYKEFLNYANIKC